MTTPPGDTFSLISFSEYSFYQRYIRIIEFSAIIDFKKIVNTIKSSPKSPKPKFSHDLENLRKAYLFAFIVLYVTLKTFHVLFIVFNGFKIK